MASKPVMLATTIFFSFKKVKYPFILLQKQEWIPWKKEACFEIFPLKRDL